MRAKPFGVIYSVIPYDIITEIADKKYNNGCFYKRYVV